MLRESNCRLQDSLGEQAVLGRVGRLRLTVYDLACMSLFTLNRMSGAMHL